LTEQEKPLTKEQTEQYCKERIESWKGILENAKIQVKKYAEQQGMWMPASWSYASMGLISTQMIDILEWLRYLALKSFDSGNEVELKQQIVKINKMLKKHSPALNEMTRIMNEGKAELRKMR